MQHFLITTFIRKKKKKRKKQRRTGLDTIPNAPEGVIQRTKYW